MNFTIRLVLFAIALALSGCGDSGRNSIGDVIVGSKDSTTSTPTTGDNPVVDATVDPVGGGEFGSGPWPALVASTSPTTYMLIDTAIAAGTLDPQTGLVYKVYSDFGDPRLPAPYQGDDRSITEGHALQEAKAYHATVGLSQANQDLLAPFLTPAFQAGSWWHLANPSATVAAADTPKSLTAWLRKLAAFVIAPAVAAAPTPCEPKGVFTCPTLTDWKVVKGTIAAVWYLGANETTDLKKATDLLVQIETKIWPALTTRMATMPPVDGSGLYPFILMDLPKGGKLGGIPREGLTMNAGFLCTNKAPSWSYLDRSMEDPKLRGQAAHEFMHALQYAKPLAGSFTCPIKSYPMLMEATAVWATHYVYPKDNVEHIYAKSYLADADSPYEHKPDNDLFRYGGYLFPLFLHMQFGSYMIPAIWDAAATQDTEYKAMEAALNKYGSSLKKIWPKFAVALANKKSSKSTAKDSFQVFDPATGTGPGLVDSVPVFDETGSKSATAQTYPMDPSGEVAITNSIPALPHLSSGHVHYIFNDANIRSLLSINGLTFRSGTMKIFGSQFAVKGMTAAAREGRSIRVLLKLNGDWNSEPTTLDNVPWITACRGDPAGKIEEMIVIYSNGEFDPAGENYTSMAAPANASGTLLSNIACMQWTLNLGMTKTLPGGKETLVLTDVLMKTAVPTAAPQPGEPPIPYPLSNTTDQLMIPYGWVTSIVSGSVDWSYLDAGTDCTTKGSLSTALLEQTVKGIGIGVNAYVSQALNPSLSRGFIYSLPVQANLVKQGAPLKTVTTCKSGGTPIVQNPFGSELELTVLPGSAKKLDANGTSASGTEAQTAGGGANSKGTWSLSGQ